ncbi:MAG: chromate transporter [Coprococcus sp.]
MSEYIDLFITFAKIGGFTFGGGYAMLPILQREVVEKKEWVTEDELMDYYAIGQCTPGIIAVNTATFIGYKQKGILGGIIATLGCVFPSMVIISVIAAFIQNFAQLAWVQSVLSGIRACVCVLIFNSVVKLGKKALSDFITWFLFVVVLVLSGLMGVSNILLVVAAGIAGILWHTGKEEKK